MSSAMEKKKTEEAKNDRQCMGSVQYMGSLQKVPLTT